MSDTPYNIDELKLAVQRSPLLRALVEVAPEHFQSSIQDETFPTDTILFREGDPADRAYAIWSGKLRVQHDLENADPLIIRECFPGDVVGEVGLVDSEPRSATIIVTEEARLISFSREDLLKLLREKPEASLTLLQTLSYRLRSTDDYLVAASYSVANLSQRIHDAKEETEVAAYQWGGLSFLFYEMSQMANDLKDGIVTLRKALSAYITEGTRGTMSQIETRIKEIAETLERIRIIEVLETGRAALQIEFTSIGAITQQAAIRFKTAAQKKKLKIDVDVASNIPNVWADSELIHEALIRIMENDIYVLMWIKPF